MNRRRAIAAMVVASLTVAALAIAAPPSVRAQVPSGTWRLRICYSTELKRSDASLVASELKTYALAFRGGGSPDLSASAGFPGGLTMTGSVEGSTWNVTNWYVGADAATRTKSRGTARVTLSNGVGSGSWSTLKGNSGTWVLSTGTPTPCPSAASKVSTPVGSSRIRVRVQTAPTHVAGVVVNLGGTSVTTTEREVFADIASGPLTISAAGPVEVRSILIRSTGGDALANDGTGAHCTGSSARLTLDPSSGADQKQDYIVIVGLPGSTTPRGVCKGTHIAAPRGTPVHPHGPGNLERFDAEVTFAGDPFLSPNCGLIASQHIQVSIHGGVNGGGPDPFYGGGNISEYEPREIVPGSPTAPPDCESNGFVFWAIDGDFHVEHLPTGIVRVLELHVWVAGGGDRSRPQQCQTPTGLARLVGTITLIDSDEFLRPQNIEADAIIFGPFGAGCTAHDRSFSNVAFKSTIGWISKAIVELACEAPGTGLSPKNCA